MSEFNPGRPFTAEKVNAIKQNNSSMMVGELDVGGYRHKAAMLLAEGSEGNPEAAINRIAALLEGEHQQRTLLIDDWRLIHALAKEKLDTIHSQSSISPFVSTSKLYSLAKTAERKLKAEGEWE